MRVYLYDKCIDDNGLHLLYDLAYVAWIKYIVSVEYSVHWIFPTKRYRLARVFIRVGIGDRDR